MKVKGFAGRALLAGAGCSMAVFALGDGLCVPRNSFHMTVVERLLSEQDHGSLRFFDGFVSSLNLQRRVPNVVVEEMDSNSKENNNSDDEETKADRSNCQFTALHEAVPRAFGAALEDYRGSGYTRGHMAAAGNFVHRDQQSMCDTFVLGANIVPQEARNNQDFWFRMELLARRDLPRAVGDKLYVLSGPAYLPLTVNEDPDKGLSRFRRHGQKTYLTHEVVGAVSVPTHLYKVYISLPPNEAPLFSAFVVPNKPIRNKKLSEFQVSREELQAMVGFEILPRDPTVASLCEKVGGTNGCDELIMSDEQYKSLMLFRRLGWAKSASELEAVWNKAAKKHVIVDEASRKLYEKKKAQLS